MSEGSPTERFGPYIVYEQLGIGGMAQVHRAIRANTDSPRPVALKRMLSHIANSEDMVKSFVREAKLASYLRHQNVAATYDLGRVGDVYFIVMELITGRNLREALRHCGATTGPMPVPMALNILNQVCDALDYAHNLCDETGQPLGIIHRDVSPSNVIVSNSGVVKLIDFGIAKASAAGMQTMSGVLKGKFAYMAPEYLAGRIDARADLFAVGVIAHELLTNRPLFAGRDDIDTLSRVRSMRIEPPSKKNPSVPPEIDDVVMTALARDPERRWQHATALRTVLTTLTRRLGMVASNAEVVQWLDWAFAQRAPGKSRPDHDTQTDVQPLAEEPSISIQIGTGTGTGIGMVDDPAASGKITLVRHDGEPDPPTKTPLGTPGYVPAQHALAAGLAASAVERSGPVPRAATSNPAPPMSRPSAGYPRAPSQPPPMSAAQPASRSSQPIPMAPALQPVSPQQPPPMSAAQPALRSSQPIPMSPAPQPVSPSQPLPMAQPALRSSQPIPMAPAPQPVSPSQPLPMAQPAPRSSQLIPTVPAPRPSSSPQAPPPQAPPPQPPPQLAAAPPAAAQPAQRPSLPSHAPPIATLAMPMIAQPPAPGAYPGPHMPSVNPAPFAAARPARASQVPISTTPGMAPPPAIAGSQPLVLDSGRAAVQREATAQPVLPIPPLPAPRSPLLTVLLVLLAAAAAATVVYLVLPLLT